MEPTRRDVLQLLVASWSAGCAVRGAGAPAAATAVLEPDERSCIVAIATAHRIAEATVELGRGAAIERRVRVALVDGLGAARLDGLAADTRYELAVVLDGARTRHRVRTAPRPDDPRPVRLAIVADVDPSFDTAVADAVVGEDPELVISIGDFPYADQGAPHRTLAEYRAWHAAIRSHPALRGLLEHCGLRAIYDDHEFTNDWDRERAEADPAGYQAALRAWDEFFPLGPAATGEVRYRSWRWGQHLECFLLDCRRFRGTNTAPDDTGKTMLGPAQLAWLIDGVTRSAATFKLILTSVPLDFGVGLDHWAAYTTERDRLFAALVGVPGVLFVSGDQHWFAAHRHGLGIRELQIGPLARGLLTPPPAAPGVMFRAERFNAGLVEVDGDHLVFSAVGGDGERFYAEALTAAELTPRIAG